MAKAWAKPFYNSKAWKDLRDAYVREVFGMCELCDKVGEELHHEIFLTPENINDPNITLNRDNLIYLCKTCHNVEHDKAYNLNKEKLRKLEVTDSNVCFDEHGDIVPRKNVFIVYGSPCSGKTTYVKENKGEYDVVFDLDYIIQALSLDGVNKASVNDCVPFAIKLREYFYELIESRACFFERVWIVAGLYDKQEREQLTRRLKAELVFIDTDIETCKERARFSDERKDKRKQYDIIDYYFKNLT